MPAKIHLIDEKGSIINKLDFGKARMGFPVSRKFKVFNAGDEIAYNIKLKANGDKAATWKQFRMYDHEEAIKELSLGDLAPLAYFEGTKTTVAEWMKDMLAIEMWNTGVIEYKNDTLKYTKTDGSAAGIAGSRIDLNLNMPKNIEIAFKTKMIVDKSFDNPDATLINFPIRMNSNGDRKGYCISFRRRKSDDKLYIAILKDGLGMVANDERDYGKNLYNTGWMNYNEDMLLGFKIYNNIENNPCIEVYIDDKQIELMNSSKPSEKIKTFEDKTNTAYKRAGKCYLDCALWNGDISLELTDTIIKTEISQHLIAMETVIGTDAINDETYDSFLDVTYEEDIKEDN